MKIITVLLVLLLTGCAAPRPAPVGELLLVRDARIHGMTGEGIFDKSKVWIERHLYSKRRIIETADREGGVIVANGYIDYPASGLLQSIERVQYKISFVMREEITDSRILIMFSELMLDVPPRYYHRSRLWHMDDFVPGYSVPVVERSDFEAAERGLLPLADSLLDHLGGKD